MPHYEKLQIWTRSVACTEHIYKIIRNSTEFCKDFGLRDQIQRSSVSIASNIAEGSERETKIEFIRYLIISRGSIAECRTQILIAKNIGYIGEDDYNELEKEFSEIHKMINGLITSLRNK